jgi:hypothetical protein
MNQMMTEPPVGNVPLWDTPTVAALAGIEQQTLLGWRRRNHFLGGPKEGAQGKAGYMHNLTDTLVACAVADIVQRGVDVQSAVIFEDDLRSAFSNMLDGLGNPCTVVGVYPRGRDEQCIGKPLWSLDDELSIREALNRSPTRTMLLIDLQPIMNRVLLELKVAE